MAHFPDINKPFTEECFPVGTKLLILHNDGIPSQHSIKVEILEWDSPQKMVRIVEMVYRNRSWIYTPLHKVIAILSEDWEPLLQLQLGKFYRNREGEVKQVVKDLKLGVCRFVTTDGRSFATNGRYRHDQDDDYDLIEEMEMTAQQMIAQSMINDDLHTWAKDKLNARPYGYTDEVLTLDFNREMFAPGQNPEYPDGVVGIRTDDDFFIIARLPWRFKDLHLQAIICTLWPDIGANQTYTLGYDRGLGAEYTLLGKIQEVVDHMKMLDHQFIILKDEFKDLYAMAEKASTPIEIERIRKRIEDGDAFPL